MRPTRPGSVDQMRADLLGGRGDTLARAADWFGRTEATHVFQHEGVTGTRYSVAVRSSDATRARGIVDMLPVSRDADGEPREPPAEG